MKTRIIHTRFWQDSFVCELSHKEKLLFVYLFTNDRVNITGIYELPDKYIMADLNLTSTELTNAKTKLQKAGKLFFKDGWIKIINADKYNSYTGEKLIKARENELSQTPKELIEYRVGIDTSIDTSIDTPNNHKSLIINNKEEVVKEKQYNNLDSIDDEIIKKIADHYKISVLDVNKTNDAMFLWCKSKGKTYKDYRAGLMNWVQRRLEEGKIKKL